MAKSRDLLDLLARYGRQLLVSGADMDAQRRLADWCLAVAHDGAESSKSLASVASHYIVAAGFGTAAVEPALGAELLGLDSALTLGQPTPPVVNVYVAARDYGMSVDLVIVEALAQGQVQAGPAEVCTLIFTADEELITPSLVEWGALVADEVLDGATGRRPWAAVVHTKCSADALPEVTRLAAVTVDQGSPVGTAPPGLLSELYGTPEVLAVIHRDCEERYPNEACGLITRAQGGALKVHVCDNLQDRYHELDPQAYPRTARAAFKLNERLIMRLQDAGEELLGIYHSHCEAGAYFSAEDVRSAAPEGEPLFPGVGNLVVSVMGGSVAGDAMFHFDPGQRGFIPERRP